MTVDLTTGNQSVVTSTADAEIYAGIHGEENYCTRTPPEASMPNANTLVIGPANFSQNGHQIRLKGNTEFTIPTGVQAQKRSNLCVLRTTKTRDEETMETVEETVPLVLSGDPTMDGNPTDPAYIEGNLLDGDTIADFPLYRVVTDGINALTPEPLFDVLMPMAELQQSWDSIKQGPVIKAVNLPGGTIAAGSSYYANASVPNVAGYECCGIVGYNVGSVWATASSFRVEGSKVCLDAHNPFGNTSVTVEPSVQLLYLPVV